MSKKEASMRRTERGRLVGGGNESDEPEWARPDERGGGISAGAEFAGGAEAGT